ncbi:RNA polymerase sigma factor [Mucilaginibacter terrigena]|uniref:RNA polymerase sigma factor n=1 Tax=Mucilaginibacter terrigena TaxID=2492395 RepID=UPI001396A0E6|nr:sigma-70 family RNA polymerase sigma factor [Mucilaginibacter terrigena]
MTTIIPADPKQWAGKYGGYLQKVALSKISDHNIARDLVQDTFLAGLEQLPNFKGNSSERTWLTGILLHKVCDFYRKRSLEKAKESHIVNAQINQQARFSNEELFIQKEFLTMLTLKLRKLPHLWSTVFKMKYLEEAPTDQICLKLGITSSNFWTITHRSKLQLRNYFQKTG